jgi:phage-related minor tail protein
MGEQAFVSVTQNLETALDNFVQTGKLSFSDLARSIISDLIKIQLKAQATSIFKGSGIGDLFGSIFGGFGGGGGKAFTGGIKLMPTSLPTTKPFGFADGGDPPVGVPSMVGERGPELFVPKTAGTIIPNNKLGSMSGQPQVVYNGPYIQNMSAIDTQSATQFLAQNKQAVWSANQSAQRSLPQSR